MPSINLNFLNLLHDDYNNYSNFIETGTYRGETILALEKYFSNLFTIEIKEDFYIKVKNNYKGDKIKFYLGDSSTILANILPNIKGKSIIFLDGHWSGGNTGKGEKDCPLYEELTNIVLYHKSDAIIIIDDVRLFGKGPNKKNEICNWEEINSKNIIKITKNRTKKIYYLPSKLNKKDRMIIHISSIIKI